MIQSFEKYLNDTAKLTRGCLLVLMLTTAYFTYSGAEMVLVAEGGGLMERSAALVYAVGVSSMMYLFWHHAMRIVPSLPTLRQWSLGMGVSLVGAVAILGISSWLNVLAMGGAQAQKIQFINTLTQYEQTTDAFLARMGAAASFRANLVQAEAELNGWAEREATTGAVSGYAGTGTVHAALTGTAGQMDSLVRTLDAALAEGERLGEQARASLAQLREIAGSRQPVAARVSAFADESDRLRSTLLAIGNLGIADALARELGRAAGSIGALTPSAGSATIAQAQSEALAQVQQIMSEITLPLAEDARDMSTLPMPDLPENTRLSTVRAVWVHAGDLVPYWAGGIGLDLMPLVLILFLSLLRMAVQPLSADTGSDHESDHLTLGEIKQAMAGLDSIYGRRDKKGDGKPTMRKT